MMPRKALGATVCGVFAIASTLGGCQTTTGEATGTAGGAVLGGLLGSQFGSGSGRLVATAAGAVAGSQLGRIIGGELEQALSERDRVNAGNAAVGAASEGGSKTWENRESGVKGRAEVIATERSQEDVEVKVLKGRVETPPPMDLIGEPRLVSGDVVNVRGGPGTDYQIVERVSKGDQLHAVGRVRGTAWLLAAQNDVAIGYVHDSLTSRPNPGQAVPADQEPAPEGAREVATVRTEQECRQVKQDVTLANGKTKTHTTTLCRTPSGWAPQNV